MIRNISIENRYRILIILLGLLFFVPFLGMIHLFDWDEINFAESAREMIVTGDYGTVSINFIAFWEKPPLFIWMQVLSMKLFGINEFAARFPNAICGVLTLVTLFEIGKRLKNVHFGLYWALAYGAAVLPFLYFKSGIIDPFFNLFIFAALHFSFVYISKRELNRKGTIEILISAILLGLAVLTKGPVAILLYGAAFFIYLILDRKFKFINRLDIVLFSFTLLIIGGAYHIYQIALGNWQLIYDFFEYQIRLMKTEDAGHGGSIFYHPIVLFLGVFPTSILAIETLIKKYGSKESYSKLMFVLFLVVLVIFSLVKTKIVHYSSMCYFPLSYLAANTIFEVIHNKKTFSTLSKWLLMVVGFLFALSPMLIQILVSMPLETLKTIIKDDFVIASLGQKVYWSGFEFLVGAGLAAILVFTVFFAKRAIQIFSLYFGTAFFVVAFMLALLPKIEKYSQGSAINFMAEFKGKQVWVSTLGYYSYAPFFYADKQERSCVDCNEEDFLLHGNTDRDVYFVVKYNTLQKILDKNPQLTIVKEDGGFVLLKRTDNY